MKSDLLKTANFLSQQERQIRSNFAELISNYIFATTNKLAEKLSSEPVPAGDCIQVFFEGNASKDLEGIFGEILFSFFHNNPKFEVNVLNYPITFHRDDVDLEFGISQMERFLERNPEIFNQLRNAVDCFAQATQGDENARMAAFIVANEREPDGRVIDFKSMDNEKIPALLDAMVAEGVCHYLHSSKKDKVKELKEYSDWKQVAFVRNVIQECSFKKQPDGDSPDKKTPGRGGDGRGSLNF